MSSSPPSESARASSSRVSLSRVAVAVSAAAVAGVAGFVAFKAIKEWQRSRDALYSMPAYTQLNLSQAQQLFDAFRPPSSSGERRFTVTSFKELRGGLSNSNYLFVVRDARDRTGTETKLLLKICEEKSAEEVLPQVRALALIRRLTLDETVPQAACFPRPCPIAYPYRAGISAEDDVTLDAAMERADPDNATYMFFEPSISSRPLVFYQYLAGRMVREATPDVMREVARAQAHLHAVPLHEATTGADFSFLSATPFGMFALREQYESEVVGTSWAAHPFATFVASHLPALDACAAAAADGDLPQSILHSDLFLENMMFENETRRGSPPRMLGLIDFEEMGRGPRVLDIAMTIVGCCYDAHQRLDLGLTRAFLAAYESYSPLTPTERRLFRAHLVWALLAIAYWRFQAFNIVHPGPNQRKDAYRDMQRRVEELDSDEMKRAFDTDIFADADRGQ